MPLSKERDIELFYADELQKALEERKIVVLAVSSDDVPKITRKMIPFLKENMIIINVATELQEDTYLTMSSVIKKEIHKNLTYLSYQVSWHSEDLREQVN